MYNLLSIFFGLIISLHLSAQTETKNHLIDDTYHQWKWNEEGCFDKWSVTFENKTQKTITSVTFRLIIKEKETDVVRYKKTHKVDLNLLSYEIAPSPYFNLSHELCGLENIEDLEGYYYYTEVIGIK